MAPSTKRGFQVPSGYLAAVGPLVVQMALAGALAGGVLGVVRGTQRYRQLPPPTVSFSREIDADRALAEQLTFLREFRGADPDRFDDLVRMLNEIITIGRVVSSKGVRQSQAPQLPPNAVARATALHVAIDKLLHDLGQTIAVWSPPDARVLALRIVPEIERALDAVREYSSHYVYNITMEYRHHMSYTRSAYDATVSLAAPK